MANTSAYPLAWPPSIKRARARAIGRFQTNLNTALLNVEKSLEKFSRDSGREIADVVITSNVTRADRHPADPGVCIWFKWDGLQVAIPSDKYSTVESNLQALFHIIEAKRDELRHGTLEIVRASFKGFMLPNPHAPDWRKILGVGADADFKETKAAYRRLASLNHPDKGGLVSDMAAINSAWQDALFDFAERR